jgi:hypothetical protein
VFTCSPLNTKPELPDQGDATTDTSRRQSPLTALQSPFTPA